MKLLFRLTALATAVFFCGQALSANVSLADNSVLNGTNTVAFTGFAAGTGFGTAYNGILQSGNVSFAERFAGQTFTTPTLTVPAGNGTATGIFDALSGPATAPLSLVAGLAGQNIGLIDGGLLYGLGAAGFVDAGVGEGSAAVLFAFDQSTFGFTLIGGEGGSATLNFYKRDGSLLETITLSNLASAATTFAFKREGTSVDIAGVSINNADGGGIAFSGFRFNVNSTPGGGNVPEPASLALVGMALLGLVAARKRRP